MGIDVTVAFPIDNMQSADFARVVKYMAWKTGEKVRTEEVPWFHAEIHSSHRYYSPDYPRGHAPSIVGMLESLRHILPDGHPFMYFGDHNMIDDFGVPPDVWVRNAWTLTDSYDMLRHWCANEHTYGDNTHFMDLP